MTDQYSRPLFSTLVKAPATERGAGGEGATPPSHRVAFLHGLFGRGRNFSTVAQGLLPEIESLLIDLPNHGASGWTEHFDYAELADLVAEHVVQQGFAGPGEQAIDVVGHSMGGKVAMMLALRHPELVRRLIVVDISPVPAARGEFPHLLSALTGLDLAGLERRVDAHEALREAIPSETVRGFLLQNLQRRSANFAWEPNLAMLHAEIDTVMGFPVLTGLQFGGPVLWIRGERSGYVTDADKPAMRTLFPRTRLLTVHGAGHWVHSERLAEFVSAVRSFVLADHDAASESEVSA